MRETISNSSTMNQLQSVLGGVKDLISSEGDLNIEKDRIRRMIEQVDYLVGKHDEYCEQIYTMLSAMVDFDFSQRLTSCEDDDNNLINVISQGLNMLNEEFQEKAINKSILHTLLDNVAGNKVVIITDSKNNIIFAQGKQLPNFREDEVRGKSISVFFNQYELIVHLMRADSLTKNLNINMTWNESIIPVSLKIGLTMNCNKIDGVTYVADLPGLRINS
jgi:hypothetical protein